MIGNSTMSGGELHCIVWCRDVFPVLGVVEVAVEEEEEEEDKVRGVNRYADAAAAPRDVDKSVDVCWG